MMMSTPLLSKNFQRGMVLGPEREVRVAISHRAVELPDTGLAMLFLVLA